MSSGLEALLAELVFGPELDPSDAAAVSALLARYSLASEDASALDAAELRRLAVYRGLVRARLAEAIALQMPRTHAWLGEHFEPWFSRFLTERGPRTHYLRDVAGEFLDFVAPHWAVSADIPPHWIELARHEALHVEIAAMPPAAPTSDSDEPPVLSLEAGLAFCEAARLVRYAYAVHRLGEQAEQAEQADPRATPEPCPTALLAYRDADHEIRFLELSPLAASLLEALWAGAPLGAALTTALAQHQAHLDPDVLEQCSQLLADLAHRGVILAPRHVQARPEERPGTAALRA